MRQQNFLPIILKLVWFFKSPKVTSRREYSTDFVHFSTLVMVRERRVTHLLAKAVQFLLDLRFRERRVTHLLAKAVQFLLDLRVREGSDSPSCEGCPVSSGP